MSDEKSGISIEGCRTLLTPVKEKKLERVRLGIDMGGTRIKMALVRKNGDLLKEENLEARAELSLEQRLDELGEDIRRLLTTKYQLTGIGIAFPGIVDHTSGRILSKYVKYPDANKVNLKVWAEENWGVPLVLENDARAALIGEWQYGAGEGCDNLLMLTLGTGMGSAVLINGKLLRGRNFLAGNLGGHMSIDFEGELCNCGNKGCVETVGSTWALPGNFKKITNHENSSLAGEEALSFKLVFTEAAKGDRVARELKQRSLEAWSTGIINLLHAYDPEKVIIGGGIMQSGDEIIPIIEQRVKERSWLPDSGVPIVAALQTKYAGILGVCYMLNGKK